MIGVEERQLQVGVYAVGGEELLHGAHKLILLGGVGGPPDRLLGLGQRDHKLGQRHALVIACS